MSTRVSFAYSGDGDPATHYHLFEDFHDPGVVLVELPRGCVDEMDRDTVTLRLTPEMWDAIRAHACPGVCPANWQPPTLEDVKAFCDRFGAARKEGGAT